MKVLRVTLGSSKGALCPQLSLVYTLTNLKNGKTYKKVMVFIWVSLLKGSFCMRMILFLFLGFLLAYKNIYTLLSSFAEQWGCKSTLVGHK